jgi:hypothetical protein
MRGSHSFVEALEERRLLSGGSAGAALTHSGMLRVRGTNGADIIRLALHPGDSSTLDVTVNGTVNSFPLASIRKGVQISASIKPTARSR